MKTRNMPSVQFRYQRAPHCRAEVHVQDCQSITSKSSLRASATLLTEPTTTACNC
jgi:hypothetical protein